MSNVVLTLGAVTFQDFEVPEKIAYGGSQRLAVQALIGGGRVVDVLGQDDGEILFSGIFAGEDATERAQSLDVARAAGDVLTLSWDQFYYNVVIAEFAADYEKSWWIPFAIRCVIATDDVETDAAPAAYLISNDLAVVSSLLGQAGISLSGLTNPTADGLVAAQGVILAGIASTGVTLNGGVTALANAADAATGIRAVNQISGASESLAALSDMSGYVGRAAGNLAGQLL
jgi:hypothetical protein